MGIQIITAAAQLPGPAMNAIADNLPDAASGLDFAGLLALQLQPQLAKALDSASDPTTAQEGKESTGDSTDLTAGTNPNDPSLAWLTASLVPVTQMPTDNGKLKINGDDAALQGISLDKGGKQAEQLLANQTGKTEDVRGNEKNPAALNGSNENKAGEPFGNLIASAAKAQTGKADDGKPAIVADNTAPTTPTTTLTPAHGVQTHAAPQAAANGSVATPLHDARWATEFGQKVVWMAKADQQDAQISINPPQLGPIQININLNGDSATAVFASPHAEVRQALETAMPRLREMLADAGINLGQADVGSQFLQQQSAQESRQQASDSPRFAVDKAILSGPASVTAPSSTLAPTGRGEGLVDLFA